MATKHTKLAKLAVANIKTVTAISEWTDDHIICATATINGVKTEFLYCGWQILAALQYFDHPKAKKELIEYIANQIECVCDIILDTLAGVEEGYQTKAEANRTIKRDAAILKLVDIDPNDLDAVRKYAPTNGY
jgi:hypothetical protein